jgi:hypothetical protein
VAPLPSRPANRPGNRWTDRGDRVRVRVSNRNVNWFNRDWYARHPGFRPPRWHYWNSRPYYYWWRPATWVGVTGWIAGSWGQPYYYDYGTSSCYYENNVVYIENEAVATADEWASSAEAIAAVEPPAASAEVEWMPLGTFALSSDEADRDPSVAMQLAVSKDGLISGTYFNSATDTALTITGGVDSQSQRAAWTVGDKQTTVFETGIYNLTDAQTPVLIHFPGGQTQQWLLVRLDAPEEQGEAAATSPAGVRLP